MNNSSYVQVRLERYPGERSNGFNSLLHATDASCTCDTDSADEVVVCLEELNRSRLLLELLQKGSCCLPMTKEAFRAWLTFSGGSTSSLQALCDVLEVAVFLQDEGTECSAAACIAQQCAEHLASLPSTTINTASPEQTTTTTTTTTTLREDTSATYLPPPPHPHATPPDESTTSPTEDVQNNTATSCTPSYSSPAPPSTTPLDPITETLLKELTQPRGRFRKPSLPEGVASCMHHPNCTISSNKCYFLDSTSDAVHAAFDELPAPLHHLTPAALLRVMHELPLNACVGLAPPLRFFSFQAHVMHEPAELDECGTRRQSRSLDLTHEALQPSHLACMLRCIPLLPPLHSLTISNSHILDHPFPKRKKWFDPNPPDPSDRATVTLWMTLGAALRAMAPSLTHLSLAKSAVDRSALTDISSILTRLKSLDITELTVTAPPRFAVYHRSDMHQDIMMCISRLPRNLQRLQARFIPGLPNPYVTISVSTLYSLTNLTELDLSNHGLQYRNSDMIHRYVTRNLERLAKLESLDLSGNSFWETQNADIPSIFCELFRGLDSLRRLHRLSLRETGLLRALPGSSSGAPVNRGGEGGLGATAVPARGFHEYLARLSSLTFLDISNSLPHDHDAQGFEAGWQRVLAPALGRLFQLNELHASRSGLTLKSAATLMRELARITCLEVLDLSGNELRVPKDARTAVAKLTCYVKSGDAFKAAVAEAMEKDVAEGASAQASMLQSLSRMQRLRVLNLSSCNLSFLAESGSSNALSAVLKEILNGSRGGSRRDGVVGGSNHASSAGVDNRSASAVTGKVPAHRNQVEAPFLQNLEVLDLSNNCFKDAEVPEVALLFFQRMIPGAQKSGSLNAAQRVLNQNNRSGRSAKVWREDVDSGRTLRDMRRFGLFFKCLPALRELNLSDNLLTVSGVVSLLESMTGIDIGIKVGKEGGRNGDVIVVEKCAANPDASYAQAPSGAVLGDQSMDSSSRVFDSHSNGGGVVLDSAHTSSSYGVSDVSGGAGGAWRVRIRVASAFGTRLARTVVAEQRQIE